MRAKTTTLGCLTFALLLVLPLLAVAYLLASFPHPPAPLIVLSSLSSLPIAWSIYPDDYYAGGAYAPLPFGKVRYWLLGPENGQKVVLIHGLSIPAIIWRDVAPSLATHGYRVLLYDLYGRGYSDAPQTTYDTNLYTTQLALLMQYLKWDKAIVVGVSMGGGIAAAFTSQYPYLVDDRVVLIASAGIMESSDISRTAKFMSSPVVQLLTSSNIARKYLQRLANDTSNNTLKHDATNLIPHVNPADFKDELNRSSHSDSIAELVRLQSAHLPGYNAALSSSLRDGPIRGQAYCFSSPYFDSRRVLLIHGTHDKTVPLKYASKILSLLPQATREKSDLITVEGAGHDLTLSHSSLINDLLVDFLRGRRIPRQKDVSNIIGNASEDVKRIFSDPAQLFLAWRRPGGDSLFGASIVKRMVMKEVSIIDKLEEPRKREGRVICEVVTKEDMLNGAGNMHGGCAAFLIDLGSSMAIMALGLVSGAEEINTVSQSLNIIYHAPASVGETLRIVNTTITLGSRALSARTEIWSTERHRLVASGTHVKMQPSPPKMKL
ncbi:hypothetical protein APHAL10511_008039 [Amanita phalloides]|nr:hypothetical protein APHAL10511_008039 [Amanita phalloides]